MRFLIVALATASLPAFAFGAALDSAPPAAPAVVLLTCSNISVLNDDNQLHSVDVTLELRQSGNDVLAVTDAGKTNEQTAKIGAAEPVPASDLTALKGLVPLFNPSVDASKITSAIVYSSLPDSKSPTQVYDFKGADGKTILKVLGYMGAEAVCGK
jgi:hypothetical protein